MNMATFQAIGCPPHDHISYINNLINSIYGMSRPTLMNNLQVCAVISGQLLNHDLVAHLGSLPAAKLLCYELILYISEQAEGKTTIGNHKQSRSNCQLQPNKTIKQIEDHLLSAVKMIEEAFKTVQSSQQSRLRHLYREFNNFLTNIEITDASFERKADESVESVTTPYLICNTTFRNMPRSVLTTQSHKDVEDYEAWVEELEALVARKEKRVSQLNQELQKCIIQNQDLQKKYDSLLRKNTQLENQIKLLKEEGENLVTRRYLKNSKSDYFAKKSLPKQRKQSFWKEECISETSILKTMPESQQQSGQEDTLASNQTNDESISRYLLSQAISLEAFLTSDKIL